MFDSSLNNQDLSDLSTSIFTTYNGTAYGLSNEVLNPVTNIQNTSAILSLGNELIPPLTDYSFEQKIISADYLIREKFSNLINNPDSNDLLSIAYGVNSQIDLAASLLQTQIHEGFKDVQISVINSEILGNTNGAYADSLNTIFLADDFVKNNSTEVIAEVLTEEFGHFIDAQINETDSTGDEGRIFANLVFNQSLTPEELNSLKAEDDHGIIYYNNQFINIEKSELEIINNIGETLVINEDTTLVFQWTQREAKYNNEIGIIVFDNPEGKIDGVSPQDVGYFQKVLTSEKSEVIFAKGNSVGNWKQVDLKAGDYVGFYLIQNASTSEYLNNPNSITVFSSITAANTDKFDHVISTNLGKGVYRFNWEDLTGGGDKDFNDVVFNVFEKGFNAGGNNTQTVSLSVEFLSNEAAYKNEIGFYYVDDINGKINGISPTDVNYAREVFKQDNYQVIFGEGNYSGVKEYTLTGGQDIGWYLISNNTSERFLQTNANNNPNGGVVAYFSYAEANPDKLNHLIHYSNNQMGWEDVLGLGDKDYNDLVFNFNFGDPTDINPQTNNPPVVDADKTISVEENSQPITLNINLPIDFDGDTLTIMVNQLPDNSKGKITKQNGSQVNINDSLTITELTNLIFTPVADASGNSGSFVYTVSDGKGGSDSQINIFNITTNNIVSVSSINAAPEFVSNPELEIILGENYTYDANAVDEDNDTLFYSLLIAPEGLTIDNNTGVINWQNVAVGNHNISLLVADGKGGQDRQDYSLNVVETSGNRPPVFVSTPVVYGNINTEYRYQALATDADSDSITYSLNQAPLGASIDANTGLITYTPTPIPVGNLTFDTSQNPISPNFLNHRAFTDDNFGGNYGTGRDIFAIGEGFNIFTNRPAGALSRSVLTFDINSLNYPISSAKLLLPKQRSSGDTIETLGLFDVSTDANVIHTASSYINPSIYEDIGTGTSYGTFDIETGGIINNSEIIELELNDAAIDAINQANGKYFSIGMSLLSINPNNQTQAAEYLFAASGSNIIPSLVVEPVQIARTENFEVVATDNKGGVAIQNYQLSIQSPDNNNYDPVIISEAIVKASTSQNYVYDVNAIDPDEDNLTYSFVTAPLGMTINQSTGEIIWNTATQTIGNYDVTVQVIDNRGGVDTQEFVIALNNNPLGTITGFKWEDVNGNGFRDTALVQGDNPDIVFVLDVSGSADFAFVGSSIGDLNNDGLLDTRLDAEIAGFISLNQQLITQGLGTRANVAIIVFSGSAANADMDLVTSGVQLTTTPTADINNNDIVDVEEILRSITSGAFGVGNFTGTNIEAALQKVEETFTAIGTETGNGNLVFLTDGESNRGGSITDEVETLKAKGFNLSAFGVGEDASLIEIQTIDPDAIKFTSTDELLGVFGSLEGEENFVEPGLAGITVYLDLNNNGSLDINEPTQITASDDSNTPNIDETGQYKFTGLEAGTYIVREIVLTDYEQTYPIGQATDSLGDGFATVQLEAGETVNNINFGNKKIDQPIPNQAPVFTSTAPTTAQIGELLKYQATATDVNNDVLTYSLLTKPEGMAVDSKTGILIWQPKQNQTGNNRVVLRVSDGKGGLTNQEFILNTRGINTPPQIISSPNTVALLNNTYSYEVRATDPDNDTLTYSLINAIQGMTINANTGLIEYTPTQLGTPTVEIQVTDNFGGSNIQSYQLQTLENLPNLLPTITSTPQVLIGSGNLYQYDVNATDPENTTITYGLTNKPDGMTIDGNTGLISWQTQANVNGDSQITVSATDAEGGTAYQNYYIKVFPNQNPVISSTPVELAQTGFIYEYDIIAGDVDGDSLTYTLTQAPTGLTIDQFGRLRWQPKTEDEGIYPITIKVDDGRGGIVTQNYNLTVTNDDIVKPVVNIGFSSNVINIGETVNLQVQATDNVGVETLNLTVDGTPLTLNPNVPNGQINNATFVGKNAGLYQFLGTAIDEAGNIGTATIEVRVIDPSDTSSPIIEINTTNLEATQSIIQEPTDIIATVTDNNLEFYRVEFAPVESINLDNLGENDPDYVLLSEGNSNITNQTVANLDPRLLANGSYLLRITAFDFSGNGNVQGVILNVSGQNKPGDFSLEYTDLSIPLTGIPIEITRRYNSLESSNQGDFGYGWDLGLQDANIVEASPDGRDLSKDNFFGGNSFTVGTRVTLNTPDGRRIGFTFNPVVSLPGLLGAVYAPNFTPDAGVFDKLEVENTSLSIRSDGSVGLYLFGFTYNPSQYKLTTKDGTVYNYDQNFGLIDVKDRNGNTLTFSDEGIVSSTGAEIEFKRDTQGRITEIIDPDGKSVKYSYDSKGNLVAVSDRTNNKTELVYNDPNRQHFLTEIIDPLGRKASRTEYDENGQISKIIDANGNELEINFDAAASSQTIKDPFGNTITRIFDNQGNVIQEVDQLGGITLRTYDANNNLSSETDPEGNTTSYTYDNRGNKLTETDGEGNTKIYTYNANNDLLTETDALGNKTTYTYDISGNLTKREDAEGNITTYNYGANGLLTTVIDANGKTSTFSYDNFGNLTELVDPTGAKTTFTYDNNGRVTSVTDALGAITNYIYDEQGRLIEKADPEGSSCGCARGITKTEYNAAGEKIAEIDALGRRTEYRYNERGLLIETILPDSTPNNLTDNPRTKNEYDALDRLTVFTDELGRKTYYVYDALGREIEVIHPDSTPNNLSDNPRTKKEYDKAGLVIAEIDELGNRTKFEYDDAERLIKVTNALNEVTTYTYDVEGRRVSMTDALGRKTVYVYDGLGRDSEVIYPDNTPDNLQDNLRSQTEYDGLGRVISETDLSGNTAQYKYDALGRLTAVIDALNQRTEYKYDGVGNLIEQKDANGHITKFEYDSLRRLQATTLPEGQENKTIHDKIGNLIEVTDFNGVVTTYKYNERNWLIEKSFSDGTPTETFTYTATGKLATVTDNRGVTTYSYDERDRLISRTEPDGRKIQYTYDKAGNILTLNVPSGTTTYSYDALNRIDTVKDADNGVTDYDYDAVGNLIKTVFPNGVIENQQYDFLNRLLYLENRKQMGIISSYTYTLDGMGNRLKVEENDGRIVEYNYDKLYRLTQEKITDAVAGNKTIEYKFDFVGNRLQKIDSVEGTTTYTYDDNDRLLQEILGGKVTSYQYDNEGNLTAKIENGQNQTVYEWNAKGELTAVEVTENGETGRIEFEYDHNGIRVAINVDGEETRFLIDNNQQQYAQVIEEYQVNGDVKTTYTHGWDLISQDNGDNRIYYQVDGLGSTRQLTDINGAVVVEYDYDAYGNLTRKVGDVDNNYLFAGEKFDDAVDGYYLRARYYDSATGRFVSTDPFEGFLYLPVSLQDYVYGNDNPVNFIDPSGKVAVIEYAKIISEIVIGKTGSFIGSLIGFLHGFSGANLLFLGNILEIANSGEDVVAQWQKASDKTQEQAENIQDILEKTFGQIKKSGLISGFIGGAGYEIKIDIKITVGGLFIGDDSIIAVEGSFNTTKTIELRGGGYEDGYKAALLYFESLKP